MFEGKKCKNKKKQAHSSKGYPSSYHVAISDSFNPEIQFTDIEFTIKNKLIDFLTQLKGFKFVTTLVLEFKKMQSHYKALSSIFYLNSKVERI